MQAEGKNKKVIVFLHRNSEDGLKRLAKEGKAEFRHSGHFLYRERERNVRPRDMGTNVTLEHADLTRSTLFLTRGNGV